VRSELIDAIITQLHFVRTTLFSYSSYCRYGGGGGLQSTRYTLQKLANDIS